MCTGRTGNAERGVQSMTVWYRLTIPETRTINTLTTPITRQFLLRVYGRHKVVVSENAFTTKAYAYISRSPIEMTLQKAMYIVQKYTDIPYIKHYTKVCKLEVITK